MPRPSIIVSDIGLPVEDGYSLICSICELESSQDLPVPAFARSEDPERALAAGYDSHLSEPLDPV